MLAATGARLGRIEGTVETLPHKAQITATEPDAAYRIRVDVETSYLEEQSDPRERKFVFAYTITLRNEGQRSGEAAEPPLDHHGCERQGAGSARRRRGGRAAAPETRARASAIPAAP